MVIMLYCFGGFGDVLNENMFDVVNMFVLGLLNKVIEVVDDD